jgi:hypothetical protein
MPVAVPSRSSGCNEDSSRAIAELGAHWADDQKRLVEDAVKNLKLELQDRMLDLLRPAQADAEKKERQFKFARERTDDAVETLPNFLSPTPRRDVNYWSSCLQKLEASQ